MSSTHTPAAFGASVIAIGDFNPAIFSPDWLHRNQLIGDGDYQAALASNATMTSHQVSVCETESFHLQVLENRLMLGSKGVLTPALRDLAEGILLLLPHMPISALGINFYGHYQMANKEDWHKIGDVLAPKTIWQNLFDTKDVSSGLRNLQIGIYSGSRDAQESSLDMINLQIQPSNQIKMGVFILLNDHRSSFAKEESNSTAAERAASLVAHEWEDIMKIATHTFENLLNKALAA